MIYLFRWLYGWALIVEGLARVITFTGWTPSLALPVAKMIARRKYKNNFK